MGCGMLSTRAFVSQENKDGAKSLTRLLEVSDLTVNFNTDRGKVQALDKVNIYLDKGDLKKIDLFKDKLKQRKLDLLKFKVTDNVIYAKILLNGVEVRFEASFLDKK